MGASIKVWGWRSLFFNVGKSEFCGVGNITNTNQVYFDWFNSGSSLGCFTISSSTVQCLTPVSFISFYQSTDPVIGFLAKSDCVISLHLDFFFSIIKIDFFSILIN